MAILVFDNYDSFTYNLVHMVQKVAEVEVDIARNDEITLDEVARYERIILSPGPGLPSEAGLLLPLVRTFYSTKSILGVCLGHQAIAEAFGGRLLNLPSVYHGVSTPLEVLTDPAGEPLSPLFKGLPTSLDAGRYHSWIVNKDFLPRELQPTAIDDNGEVMAMQHRDYNVQGVQFHPESVLTPFGETILKNWLDIAS